MGSKLRKLRQKAGVTGHAYQAKQRSQERARVRAADVGSQVALTSKYSGSLDYSAFTEARSPLGKVYDGNVESLTIGGREVEVVPAAPSDALQPQPNWHIHRPGVRSRLFTLLALSAIAGLSVPPRGDR